MKDFVRLVFHGAIVKERAAQKMYLKMAKIAKNKKAKTLLEKLAEEEGLHEMLLSKMNFSVLKIVNSMPLKRLNILKDFGSKDAGEKEELKKLIDFAISEEERAYKDYSLMMRYIDFGSEKEILAAIAQQEIKHKSQLEKLKEVI
jgi:rubrerythrin